MKIILSYKNFEIFIYNILKNYNYKILYDFLLKSKTIINDDLKNLLFFINKNVTINEIENLQINNNLKQNLFEILKFNNNEEEYYSKIINLFEYYNYINIKELNLNEIFIYFFSNLNINNKNSEIFLKNLKNFFKNNIIELENNLNLQNNLIQNLNINNNNNNKNTEENIENKINYIYDSIKSINFDSPILNNEENKIESDLNKSNLINNNNNNNNINNDNEIFFTKLKVFSALKKYYLHRKSKASYLSKKSQLIQRANNFYSNLLKSRTFFGFVKISKQNTNFNLIKNNYIDFHIKELSKNLLNILVFCYNRKKILNIFLEKKNKKLKIEVFNAFKNRIDYQKSFNYFFFNQIIKNQSAIDFLLMFKIKRKKNVFKNNFYLIENKKNLILKKKIFNFLKNFSNKIFNENIYNFNYKLQIFYKNKFFDICKRKLVNKYKIFYFEEKIAFIRLKNLLMKKKSKILLNKKLNKQKNNYQNNNNNSSFQDSYASNFTFNANKNSTQNSFYNNNNNKNENNFYSYILKKKAFNLLIKNYNINKNIIKELNKKHLINQISLFFKYSRIKTIESLIIQGIKEKIKIYQKILLLKILFSSNVSKIKFNRAEKIRKKYLKKTIFNLFKTNKNINNLEKILIIKFYYKFFILKTKLLKNKNKFFEEFNEKKLEFKIMIKNIKNKINSKKKIILFKFNHKKNSFKYFFHLFRNVYINKNYNKFNYKFYASSFNLFIKNINNLIINNSLKFVSKKLLKKKLFDNFLNNINNKKEQNSLILNLNNISKKFYLNTYLTALDICLKSKNLNDSISELNKTKIKKKIFNQFKKYYLDKIKYNMLTCRYKEYLFYMSIKKMLIKYNKNNK